MTDYFTSDFTMPEEEEREAFRIDSDALADWALRKIGEREQECGRICEIAEAQIDRLNAQIDAENERCTHDTSFLISKLNEYFATVKHRETATTEKYKLLSGTLVMRKAKTKPVYDDSALIDYLRGAGLDEYIKVKETPAWGDFKKTLDLSSGIAVVKDTGEIFSFIEFEEVPATFSVEVD